MTITLADLRLQSRKRADMEHSQFVSDSELTFYINNSVAELHDILSDAYGSEYFVVSTAELPIIANTDTYALPSDFYELKGVDVKVDTTEWVTVQRYNFNERNRYSNSDLWNVAELNNVRYRLVGSNLTFNPMPNINATYRVWYTPLPTILVNDADELNDFNAYSEYVIVDAAIKMMQKEESDVTVLFAQKSALEKRIREKAQNRDAASTETIIDVYSEGDAYSYRRGV